MRPKTLLSWSTGKDAAWTLHELRRANEVDVIGLVSVVSRGADRVAMHSVREQLLQQQAGAARVPLWTADIPDPCSPAEYATSMQRLVERARAAGVTNFAFGDLYLEDVRARREENLRGTGLTPIFPLWGRRPRALAQEMVAAGLRAVLVSVDPNQLDPKFCGRIFDDALLRDLPQAVDPCGERGEFHTFTFAGPMFAEKIDVLVGETVMRDGYAYADLLASSSHGRSVNE